MRICTVSIQNFRSLASLNIDLEGRSRFLIGENAVGKSSLLTAIARALARDSHGFQRDDFHDRNSAIDIRLVLIGLNDEQCGVFADAADFGDETTLTVGVCAIWDPDAEEVDVTHGYPTKDWRRSSKDEREALSNVHWIGDARDPCRILQLGWRRSLLGDLLSQIELDDPLTEALRAVKAACDDFTETDHVRTLLSNAGRQLSSFLPGTGDRPFSLSTMSNSDFGFLRQLQLTLASDGIELPLSYQSSGLGQLALFAFAMLAITSRGGGILLIDEPELSLHPQCQRALLAAIERTQNQYLIATHSASILDRADPRHIVRLHRVGGAVRAARGATLTDREATRLSRFTTARNAEAFFARTAILVEGESDRFALEALARKKDRSLDAEGVSIVVLQGAGSIRTFLALLGPRGLSVNVVGLCDANESRQWGRALQEAGVIKSVDQAAMNAAGFFVADRDLEDVLISALGEKAVKNRIAEYGDAETLATFIRQPAQSGKSGADTLHDFVHSAGRQIEYAPILVDLLDEANVPDCLAGVLDVVSR